MRRRGLRLDPPNGWPLDRLLVGVGTLRTLRELLRLDREWSSEPVRAWDLALRTGVSTPGSGKSLGRMHRLNLVRMVSPARPRYAPTFRVDRTHPLVRPLEKLFEAEWAAYGRVTRRERLEQRRLQRQEIREHQEMLERRRKEMRKGWTDKGRTDMESRSER